MTTGANQTDVNQAIADEVLEEIFREWHWLERVTGCDRGINTVYIYRGSPPPKISVDRASSDVGHDQACLEHFWRIRGKNG